MRYSGKLGITQQTELRPGIWDDVLAERDVVGTVETRTEAFSIGDSILPQYRTTTSVSVLGDGVDKVNYSNIAYVTYLGKRWTPASITINYPRLTIFLGEEYHGPTPQ